MILLGNPLRLLNGNKQHEKATCVVRLLFLSVTYGPRPPKKAPFLASHLSRAVYSPFNNIITIKSLVRRRAGVPILSFEDGADSAKRSPRSASVCTQYEHFAHPLRSVQNAKWHTLRVVIIKHKVVAKYWIE